MKPVYFALAATFAQQSFATMSKTVVPVISPVIVDAFGVSPAMVGVYVTISSTAYMIIVMGCGGLIVRYGALRMSQISLMVMAAGLAVGAGGTLALAAVMAVVIGGGSTVATPASSHLLARYAPPKYAPLIFSIKQTAVPVGLILSGLLGPLYVGLFGWQGALVAMAAMCLLVAAVLQPTRAEFDADRDPTHPLSPKDVLATLRTVLTSPTLRAMTLAAYTFVGLQFIFSAYFVIYLAKGLGHSLAMAGLAFSIAIVVAVPARIFWGWVGSRFLAPRRLLAMLGFGMAAASVGLGLITPAWPLPAIVAVAAAFSATALSWHGVLLAEVARIAPKGRIGGITGGVLSFGGAGQMTLPLAFAGILALTGRYSYGFFLAAALALIAGLILFRQQPPGRGAAKRIGARHRPGSSGGPGQAGRHPLQGGYGSSGIA